MTGVVLVDFKKHFTIAENGIKFEKRFIDAISMLLPSKHLVNM